MPKYPAESTKKNSPAASMATGLLTILCFENRPAEQGYSAGGPSEAGGGVPLDTRRWSTGFTTQLAYITIVQ